MPSLIRCEASSAREALVWGGMSDAEEDAERSRALTLLRVQGGQAAKRDELAEARAAAAAHHQKALEAARALEEAQARVETAEREARAQVV